MFKKLNADFCLFYAFFQTVQREDQKQIIFYVYNCWVKWIIAAFNVSWCNIYLPRKYSLIFRSVILVLLHCKIQATVFSKII
jgi:hypothetical protein